MRFRPANIRLINRRPNLPRLLLALFSGKSKNRQLQKQPHRFRKVDTVTPYQGKALIQPRFRLLRMISNENVFHLLNRGQSQ